VIGIRLQRRGRGRRHGRRPPGNDILVLTETGYGKRVRCPTSGASTAAARASSLISLEGAKTGRRGGRPLVDERTRSCCSSPSGGQIVRTDVGSVNRYGSQAPPGRDRDAPQRGRPGVASPSSGAGLANSARSATMTSPIGGPGRAGRGPSGSGAVSATGVGRRARSAIHYDLYTGNANPRGLARKIAGATSGRDLPGRAEVFQFANENIFVRIEDNVRERTSSSSSPPAGR
jgi:hypothetical protein